MDEFDEVISRTVIVSDLRARAKDMEQAYSSLSSRENHCDILFSLRPSEHVVFLTRRTPVLRLGSSRRRCIQKAATQLAGFRRPRNVSEVFVLVFLPHFVLGAYAPEAASHARCGVAGSPGRRTTAFLQLRDHGTEKEQKYEGTLFVLGL